MKKLLFIAYKFHGYEKLIKEAIEKKGIEVDYIEYNPKELRKYTNFFQKIYDQLYLRPFRKKNQKSINYETRLNEKICKLEKYDYVLRLGTIILPESTLKILQEKSKKMIAVFWDTLKPEKNELSGIEYFDKKFSYDEYDCKAHNLEFLPNFYIKKQKEKVEIKYDIFTIMADKQRLEFTEKLAKKLKENNINYLFKFYISSKEKVKSDYIEIINKTIPAEKVNDYVNKSLAILEIKKEEQRGVSLRAFEALGLKKKLITTNQEIKKYDFYNPNNILVIQEDFKELELGNFFKMPYEEIDKEIYKKYSIESWIDKILN